MPARLGRDETHKGRWLRKLAAEGFQPEIHVLEEVVNPDDLEPAEIRWIAEARTDGWPLTNLTDGGEGMRGFTHGPEAREKIRQAKLGKPRPDLAARNAAQAGKPGRKQSLEEIEKRRASLWGNQRSLGRVRPESERRAIAEAKRGIWRKVPRVRINLLGGAS